MTILLGLRPYTRHTVTSPDRFRRALAVTRLTGVAITREEFEAGISGVAMPLFGPDGAVVAAIEVTVTVTDLHRDLHPVITALTIAARSLTREITANAPPATRQAATSLS
jgi:DNA-binding IclR family transcriptional regulator